jgi:hypothetical protein
LSEQPAHGITSGLDSGIAYTFTLNTAATTWSTPVAFAFNSTLITSPGAGTFGEIVFYNPTKMEALGVGAVDFGFFDNGTSGVAEYYTGDQLYTGSETSPTFTPGTYVSGTAPLFGGHGTGIIVIDGGPTVVPEPSTLVLLATGALALGISARRLFHKG